MIILPCTFCVTVKVFPVSKGTVQFTGSGDRIIICSGDLTLVGSGGDFTIGSSISEVGSSSSSTKKTHNLKTNAETDKSLT